MCDLVKVGESVPVLAVLCLVLFQATVPLTLLVGVDFLLLGQCDLGNTQHQSSNTLLYIVCKPASLEFLGLISSRVSYSVTRLAAAATVPQVPSVFDR